MTTKITGADIDAYRNTILAALRYYQEHGQGEPANRTDAIHDIATGGEDNEQISLDAAGIDELCEFINTEQVRLAAEAAAEQPPDITALRELLNRYRPICCHNSEDRNWHAPECPVPAAERAIALLETKRVAGEQSPNYREQMLTEMACTTGRQYDGKLLHSLTAAATRAAEKACSIEQPCADCVSEGLAAPDGTLPQQPEKAPEHCAKCEDSRWIPDPDTKDHNIPCTACCVLTAERKAWYLAHRGDACPFCFDTRIEADAGVEVSGGIAWQKITCTECNREWCDDYTLDAVTIEGQDY